MRKEEKDKGMGERRWSWKNEILFEGCPSLEDN